MLFSAVIATLAIRQILLVRLEEQVKQALEQEVQEFRLLIDGRNPITAQPFGENMTAIFSVFLNRNIPKENEYLITLLPNQFYGSSPLALPSLINKNSETVQYWQSLTQPEQSDIGTLNDRIVYLAEPVNIGGEVRGVFVIAISIAQELEEVNEAIVIIIQVIIVVTIIASILAWIIAGQVLTPLRLLTNTARSITETDLTQRISVKGSDEIAELGNTFNEMLNRLQAAFTNQKQFLDDVGHELRTPITIVQGHLDLMGDDPQEQRETLNLVTDELNRMNRLVADLMLLAKTKQPDFLNLETIHVGVLTKEMYAKAKALSNRDWRLDQIGSGLIVVDRQRVTQAIMNLAQNATQYTQETDVIAIGSEMTQGCIRFWVRDTGTGIPLAEQARIFGRFARGSNGHRSDGTGLGLSIVKAIAQSHGGSVEVVSQPGHGSTFTLVLPLDPPPPLNLIPL
jgi:signal transduction histidine kinase